MSQQTPENRFKDQDSTIKAAVHTHLTSSQAGCFFLSDRYFHKVPADAPALELKASYGLAEPTPFELPALNAQCTPEVYSTFDLTKGPKDDKVKATRFTFVQQFALVLLSESKTF